MICTFFGHHDCPNSIKENLRDEILNLINSGVKKFYVGNQGNFDSMARKVLKEFSATYDIQYSVVLAYMPKENEEGIENSLLPEGIEKSPPRFAISWRNKWMIEQSNYVITYVTHSFGGAAQFKELAEKKGKTVVNLGD